MNLFRRKLTIPLSLMIITTLQLSAQNKSITGHVLDGTSRESLIGATILTTDKSIGTVTDLDGNFKLVVPKAMKQIIVTYIGYQSKIVDIKGNELTIQLMPDEQVLNEVVVIGYGTSRRSDLTGSVSTVKSKDFNKGMVSSPEQLINGKVAGVQAMSNSGSATSGYTIRIRGGASLNASNDPLIVLDGIPLEQGGISGNSNNFLSMINPNDIESMTVLKDASSTAIYGSRASNGVIIITTKKGNSGKLKIAFNSTNSLQTRTKMVDMMSRREFINTITQKGTDSQKALLGVAHTNWNNEVYHKAFGTDNNISIGGKVGFLPFRISLGYMNQDGLVRTDNAERITNNIVLSPIFFENHLKVTVNAKSTYNNNQFNNSSAIWSAATYNPTIPIHMNDQTYGGYNTALDASGLPVNGSNPAGLINQYDSKSTIKRFIGSVDLDYKLHFFPKVKLHARVGTDIAEGKGTIYIPLTAASNYLTHGEDYSYGPQKNSNQILTLYTNYSNYFETIKSNVEATLGYDYQYWKSTTPSYDKLDANHERLAQIKASDFRHTLLSYYARLNYSFDSKYLLTATVRRDGTSRFAPDSRWGTFPSVALGWNLTQESWLKNQTIFNNLKLRASFGITGQQDGIGNYNYLPVYTQSLDGAQALINGQYIYTYRPESYVSNLKWETTTSWDFGFDFALLDNKISGSFDYYTRKTKDLLATVPTAAGTNFAKNILTNVGNVNSHGLEFSINAIPIKNKDWEWNLSYNITWEKMKVQNLSLIKGKNRTNILVGPSIDAYQFQVLTEGFEPYMFQVYQQLYDKDSGKPIEGAYADLNKDGKINSSDLYRYHSPAPDYIMGFSTSVRRKKWTLGGSFRANIGNYVFNGMAMNTGAWETVSYNSFQLNNLNRSYLKTNFQTRQYLSDYYVENASFLKLDNITLSYDFGKVSNSISALTISGMIQNVFTITNYTGVDPEVPNGMDNSFYPRPRTYSLSIGLQF